MKNASPNDGKGSTPNSQEVEFWRFPRVYTEIAAVRYHQVRRTAGAVARRAATAASIAAVMHAGASQYRLKTSETGPLVRSKKIIKIANRM